MLYGEKSTQPALFYLLQALTLCIAIRIFLGFTQLLTRMKDKVIYPVNVYVGQFHYSKTSNNCKKGILLLNCVKEQQSNNVFRFIKSTV